MEPRCGRPWASTGRNTRLATTVPEFVRSPRCPWQISSRNSGPKSTTSKSCHEGPQNSCDAPQNASADIDMVCMQLRTRPGHGRRQEFSKGQSQRGWNWCCYCRGLKSSWCGFGFILEELYTANERRAKSLPTSCGLLLLERISQCCEKHHSVEYESFMTLQKYFGKKVLLR